MERELICINKGPWICNIMDRTILLPGPAYGELVHYAGECSFAKGYICLLGYKYNGFNIGYNSKCFIPRDQFLKSESEKDLNKIEKEMEELEGEILQLP